VFTIPRLFAGGRPGRWAARAAGICAAAALALCSVTGAAAAPRGERAAAAVTGGLFTVSCFSASNCMAAGQHASTAQGPGGSLTEHWNGTKWAVVTSPNPAGSSGTRLDGVACTAAKSCLAVGDYSDSASHDTLPTAQKWNGTKWSLVTVPAPSGATDTSLGAIACTATANCWAVGASGESTLGENWNGTKWSIVSTPSPNPGKPDDLSGVTCPASNECWAVGDTFPGDFSGSLTEKWNGTAWAVVGTPNSGAGELIGASCSATADCVSVGIGNNLFAIAQLWKGTAWAKTTPKKPSGATESELNGVSCPSGGPACEAVGFSGSSSGTPALAEGWTGSAWALQSTPAISGSSFTDLEGVSCTTPGSCWAVGQSQGSSGTSTPLIEQWNGTSWSVTS
jgi:hypothetical protein